jgi:hypothetical protein
MKLCKVDGGWDNSGGEKVALIYIKAKIKSPFSQTKKHSGRPL